MADINMLPTLHEGDQGHIDVHNIIRDVLFDHEARMRRLEEQVGRLVSKPWLPEDPDNHEGRPLHDYPRQNPEVPEQPPKRHNPEFPGQSPAAHRKGR